MSVRPSERLSPLLASQGEVEKCSVPRPLKDSSSAVCGPRLAAVRAGTAEVADVGRTARGR